MQLGLLPLVLSEVGPAPLPPALLYTNWSKSCASLTLWELESPLRQVSAGVFWQRQLNLHRPSQIRRLQYLTLMFSTLCPLRHGGTRVMHPFPGLTPWVITVRVHFVNLELGMYHLVLYWTQCISHHDWCVVPLAFLQWYNPIFLISRLNTLIPFDKGVVVSVRCEMHRQ